MSYFPDSLKIKYWPGMTGLLLHIPNAIGFHNVSSIDYEYDSILDGNQYI